MPNKSDLTGQEPQLSDNDKSGMEPQLGGEQRQLSTTPLLLRFVAQIAGDNSLVLKLEDVRSHTPSVQLQRVGKLDQPFAPFKQPILVRGKSFNFESTGLSARLDGPQMSWYIDYVKSLSSTTRTEWALRDVHGVPLGVMRLNKPMGWLEIVTADNKAVCKTTTAPHRGGIEEVFVRTDRLTPNQEPLFLVALLFGLMIGTEFPRQGS